MTDAASQGPWRHVAIAGGWDGVQGPHGELICRLAENNPLNATLIAAVHDLRSGCSAMLGLVQLILNRDDLSAELRAVLQSDNHRIVEAEAALAKASPVTTTAT